MPLFNTPTATNNEQVLSSNFSITGSAGTYQDTGLSVSLPGAGTYLLYAMVRGELVLTAGVNGYLVAKLYNATDAADVANSIGMIVLTQTLSQTFQTSCTIEVLVSVTDAKTINLHVKRDGTGLVTFSGSTIYSDANGPTKLGYIKLA